jgi:hypothetical protein
MPRKRNVGFCSSCGQNREFRHTHETAHGIPGTHMAGTELFECTVCDESYGPKDGPPFPLRFILDPSTQKESEK